MKSLSLLVFLFTALASAQPGLNPQWYAPNNQYLRPEASTIYCYYSPMVTAGGGVLTLKGKQVSSPCMTTTATYISGIVVSNAFTFTYGKIIFSAKMGPSGIHTTLWLWGGQPGTSGYPSTCIAALKAGGMLLPSCGDAIEVDVAEMEPALFAATTIANNTHTWVNGINTASTTFQYAAGADLTAGFHTYEFDCTTTPQMIFKVDGVTTETLADNSGYCSATKMILMSVDIDAQRGPGTLPLTMQVQSVQVYDLSTNGLLFSDLFPGAESWFGIF